MTTAEQVATEFFILLKKHDLRESLPEIVRVLEKEAYRSQKITIISTLPLSEKEKTKIEEILFRRWEEHPVLYAIDPTILSGLIICFQNKVLNLSGKQALRELKQELNK